MYEKEGGISMGLAEILIACILVFLIVSTAIREPTLSAQYWKEIWGTAYGSIKVGVKFLYETGKDVYNSTRSTNASQNNG